MVKPNNSHEVTFLAGEECLYSVVKRSALSLGWKVIGEEASDKVKRDCHVIWVDKSFANDKRFVSIQPWQRINHFPGMTNICRKVRLAQSLELMKKKFPREYSFFPTTYVLPLHLAAFRSLFPNGQSMSTFIIKPDGSAQGKGIFLTKRIEDVENLSTMCVAQQYIRNPLLIEKKKFDLRIYVLVTSCCPLRIYLFRDGLVRMCTEEYKHPNDKNIRQKCMHLTNYSINKRSDKYQREEKESAPSNTGNKRTISWLLDWLTQERGEAAANELWDKIGDICVMTILSILPTLRREYDSVFGITKLQTQQQQSGNSTSSSGSNDNNSSFEKSRCFEVLGVDIMIDTKLNPILIEVNHLPSWGTDSSIDEFIKSRVIAQALSAINVKSHEKRAYERARRKQSRLRLRKMRQAVDDLDRDDNDEFPSVQNEPLVTKKRQPELFDSNSAERKIRSIYEKFAPEKLPHVKDLLTKYRGYEEWLAMKVEEKYTQVNDGLSGSCSCSDEDGESTTTDEDDEEDDDDDLIEESERAILLEEDRILEDYDRIYPPRDNGCISRSRYKEMERYVTEMDEERQRRLTCPLHEMRSNNNGQVENEFGVRGNLNRGDGWIGGNIHVRQHKQETKVFAPPTKQQIEFASRLCLGFSVEDTEVTTRSVKRKSRLLHHNLIDEEDNPFYHLIDRVRQTREISKQARGRAERRLSCRSSIKEAASSLRHQNLDLALEVPTVKIKARRNTVAFLPKR